MNVFFCFVLEGNSTCGYCFELKYFTFFLFYKTLYYILEFSNVNEMMDYWKLQYENGQFENAVSVYTENASFTIGGVQYSTRNDIVSFFTTLYTSSQTVSYTITTENAPDGNNQVNIFFYFKFSLQET